MFHFSLSSERLYFGFLVADRRVLVSGRPNLGFLAFFGLLAVFFLAAAVPAAAFLALVRVTFFTFLFSLCATFFLPGLERFLFALKEPEAPVPFTWTKSFLATSRLRAVMILALFASTSYPPAFRAFFRNASDTPALASAADAAFMMRTDTDDPAIPLWDVALFFVAAEDFVKVSSSGRGRYLLCPYSAAGSDKGSVRTVECESLPLKPH